MAKTIVILIDGTNHNVARGHRSHIASLRQALIRHNQICAGDEKILLKYIPGVGSNHVSGFFDRAAEVVLGNLFGYGLNRDVRTAYRFLCENYSDGDQVYLFGWSRGAYIARTLIGVVRNAGIFSIPAGLTDAAQARLVKRKARTALKHYRSRAYDTRPWSEGSRRFRAWFSPNYITDGEEQVWRAVNGYDPGQQVKFAYAGIWDTVGVRGVHGVFAQVLANRTRLLRTAFHDNQLSHIVRGARHAVAIDEVSRILPSTQWDRSIKYRDDVDAQGNRCFQQAFLPGDHPTIGGSAPQTPLVNYSYDWVVRGAVSDSLTADMLGLPSAPPDVPTNAPLFASAIAPLSLDYVMKRVFGRHRDPIEDYGDVSDLAWNRIEATQHDPIPYQPFMLRHVWTTLWRAKKGPTQAVPRIRLFSR